MKIVDQPVKNLIPSSRHTDGKATLSDEGKTGFSPGTLLKGKVTGLTDDGKVLLEVNGRIVTAKSLVPLSVGSELWLEVGKGGSLPLLALAGKKGAVQEFLSFFISNSPQSPSSPGQLSSLLSSFFLNSSSKIGPDIPSLSTAMAASSTVDGNPAPVAVLALSMLLGDNPSLKKDVAAPVALSADAADKAGRIMVGHQEINSRPIPADNQNFFLFPCFFAGQSGWGEWLFSLERGEGGEQEQYSLAFFLEMSSLGPLTLQVKIHDRSLTGEFYLATEKARDYLAANVSELSLLLERQGLSPVSFSCQVSRANILHQLKETLEEKAGIQCFSLLDIKV